jgi:hypothetical protein
MDGIHVSVRLGEDPKVCLLIVIGVREDGEKEPASCATLFTPTRCSTEAFNDVLATIVRADDVVAESAHLTVTSGEQKPTSESPPRRAQVAFEPHRW